MGCGASKKYVAVSLPTDTCELKTKLQLKMKDVSSIPLRDLGVYLINEAEAPPSKCMLIKNGGDEASGKEKWQYPKSLEAKSTIDDSSLMYAVTETSHFFTGDPSSFTNEGGYDTSCVEGDTCTAVEGGSHYNWEMVRKSVIYSDAAKSKELASITVRSKGETIYSFSADSSGESDGYETYDTKLSGIKYVLVIGDNEVPLDLLGKISDESGVQWKSPMFTVEWAINWLTLLSKTRSITIEPEAKNPNLAAFLGGVMLQHLNLRVIKQQVEHQLK